MMMKGKRNTSWFWALMMLVLLNNAGIILAEDNKKDDKPKAEDDDKPQQQQEACKAGDDTCQVRIVTIDELATKTGEDGGEELWLSIFGMVYDVSKGPQYYAPKSGYHIFAGRDGTIPFITGNFTEEECNKHSDELTAAQLYALDHDWAKFYEKEEKYPFVGFLCCRFYDAQGQPTDETIRIKERVAGYSKIKAAKDKERRENRRKMKMMSMTTTTSTEPKKATS